jgi:hypothetical protein
MRMLGWLVVTMSLAGCADDARGLWITIEGPEGGVDRLVLEMVASLTSATDSQNAETCRAMTLPLPEDEGPELDFPLVWGISFGDEAWECIGVRVTGSRTSGGELINEELYCPDPDLLTEETIRLDVACLDFECESDQVCRVDERGEAQCEQSRVGALFDVAPTVERWCDGAG